MLREVWEIVVKLSVAVFGIMIADRLGVWPASIWNVVAVLAVYELIKLVDVLMSPSSPRK